MKVCYWSLWKYSSIFAGASVEQYRREGFRVLFYKQKDGSGHGGLNWRNPAAGGEATISNFAARLSNLSKKNLWKVLLGVAVVQGCWNFFVWLPDAVATYVILYISTSWSTIWGVKVISWLLLISFLERQSKKRPKQRHEKSHFCSEPMVVITTALYLVIICRQCNVWLASLRWKRFMLMQYTTVNKNRMCCVCVRENERKPGQMRENAISYCVYTSLCLCACVWDLDGWPSFLN